jgi:hypothetical protein
MSDYFHGDVDEDDPTQLMEDTELIVIGRDRRGLPCFGCYFGELFEAFAPEQLVGVDLGELEHQLSEHDADRMRRIGAGMALIADGMAFILADATGEAAVEVAAVVAEKLLQSARLHSAPISGQPN